MFGISILLSAIILYTVVFYISAKTFRRISGARRSTTSVSPPHPLSSTENIMPPRSCITLGKFKFFALCFTKNKILCQKINMKNFGFVFGQQHTQLKSCQLYRQWRERGQQYTQSWYLYVWQMMCEPETLFVSLFNTKCLFGPPDGEVL